MSATIRSKVVDLDELIPRLVDIAREENDVERLIPWIFRDSDIAREDCLIDSAKERPKFSEFFDELFPYYDELKAEGVVKEYESRDTGVASTLKASETITLPQKSWKVSGPEYFRQFISLQRTMLRELMRTVYDNLEDLKDTRIHFPIGRFKFKYVIGGEQFITKPEGAVTVGPRNRFLPIISYTGWYKGQTWSEFLEETLSVMLGQLGIQHDSSGIQDQEVFVVGFHGLSIHIARGVFTTSVISRVHSKGCSKNEAFELKFSPSYNLFLKKDWLEATRALARLFRYLQSGNAKVGSIQPYLQKVV